MKGRLHQLLIAITLCLAGMAQLHADEDSLAIGQIRDLPFGEVLFYFYQDDYFPALTRLMAAQYRGQLDDHNDDAELLRGGMMLSYGLHREAGDIFNRLLDRKAPQSIKDRAWYFLARVWYRRGYYDRAETALERILAPLPEHMQERHMMLRAQVMMARGDFNGASRLLDGWQSDGDLASFARYNLGVALVRQGRLSEATRQLEKVGLMRTTDLELLALRDRANLALGFALIQDQQGKAARTVLGRVRLSGPFSNKALLGAGWADSLADDYQRALLPWGALQDHDLLDSAVLESLLAVPYALGKLQANRHAADAYLDAIKAFARETEQLDQAIARISSGEYLGPLLQGDALSDPGWSWRLKTIPDNDESRYIYLLVASHRFQEGLRNYRDLRFLQYNLGQWIQSLAAFDDMLDTRELAFAQREPAVVHALDEVDLDSLERRQLEFATRISRIDESSNYLALASADEQSQHHRLRLVEKKLERLPFGEETSDLREKRRLLAGVLRWQLEAKFKERLWSNKKTLNDLDMAMQEAQQRRAKVAQARAEMPGQFTRYRQTINGLRPRLEAMIEQAAIVAANQQDFLQSMAIAELETQKERLYTYRVQARFALATIYDRATTQGLSP
ncbi:MAG: hypothetical protein O6931_03805 [Gammaproteobacteria bacterium]|nr:hypothetical protein [Gammaproteobacteria bacterium]